jgi:hypothetical protein
VKLRTSVLLTALGVLCVLLPTTGASAMTTKVTCHASRIGIDLGSAIHITGTVAPSAAGKGISLQQSTSKGWLDIHTGVLNNRSGYDIAFKPKAPGAFNYRVVFGTVSCPGFTVTIYRRKYLTAVPVVQQTLNGSFGGIYSGTYSINGTSYPHTISWVTNGNGEYVEWNLSRKCTGVDATVGLTDQSVSGVKVGVEISVDGQIPPLYSHDFTVGDAVHLSLNVRGALRFRVAATMLDAVGTIERHLTGLRPSPTRRCSWGVGLRPSALLLRGCKPSRLYRS